MKFDKSKVFTPFNCDEVKVGSKGYFADNKVDLIHRVESEDKDFYGTFCSTQNNEFVFGFPKTDDKYRYFYLVEEPKEKTKRPCTKEELIEMLKKQGLPMLRFKGSGNYHIVTFLGDIFVTINCECTYTELCNKFTLLDGTELWVEE